MFLWRRTHTCTLGTLMGSTLGKYSWHTHGECVCRSINEGYSRETFVGIIHGALEESTYIEHLQGTFIGSTHRGPFMESTHREDSWGAPMEPSRGKLTERTYKGAQMRRTRGANWPGPPLGSTPGGAPTSIPHWQQYQSLQRYQHGLEKPLCYYMDALDKASP